MANTTGFLDYLEIGTEKPSFIIRAFGESSVRTGNYGSYEVPVFDARICEESFSLDKQGFVLIEHPSKVDDYHLETGAIERGYTEVSELIKAVTGAARVDVVDHTVRTSTPKPGVRGIATHVHNDYTPRSCRQKFRDHLGEDLASRLSKGRVMQINVWRPLYRPVRVAPLAVLDGCSLNPNDLVECDMIYPDRRGEIYAVKHNVDHRWYYYPEMTPDEVILFKGYDSLGDSPSQFTPHTAFHHPQTREDDPPRWSVEIRAIASF